MLFSQLLVRFAQGWSQRLDHQQPHITAMAPLKIRMTTRGMTTNRRRTKRVKFWLIWRLDLHWHSLCLLKLVLFAGYVYAPNYLYQLCLPEPGDLFPLFSFALKLIHTLMISVVMEMGTIPIWKKIITLQWQCFSWLQIVFQYSEGFTYLVGATD